MRRKKKNNFTQLSLFGDEFIQAPKDKEEALMNGNKLNNSTIIKNISFDQKEILWNIMKLYNDGKPYDCDITASTLKFYERKKSDKYYIPEPKYLFDVYPQQDKIKKIVPFQDIPLEDNSIHSIVVDLPFVVSPKTCKSMLKDPSDGSCLIANRFASWYPYMEAYENMYWWLSQCNRVIEDGGIIVWKMQNTVSGGVNHWFTDFCKICGQYFGLYVIDDFVLEAKARLISAAKYKKQCHARKFTSNFIVFKKDEKLGKKFSILNILEQCKENVHKGKEWEIK